MPDWDGQHLVRHPGRPGRRAPAAPATRPRSTSTARSPTRSPPTTSGVYVVTDRGALQGRARQRPAARGRLAAAYDNGAEKKPGQLSAGSGTTPTVLPSGLVAITDNAEPRMHVQFYDAVDGGLVCEAPVFGDGESATRQLAGRGRRRQRGGREQLRLRQPAGARSPAGPRPAAWPASTPDPAGPASARSRWTLRRDRARPRSPRSRWPPASSTPTRPARAGGASPPGTSPRSTPAPARPRSRSAPAPGRCSTTTTPPVTLAPDGRRTSPRWPAWSGCATARTTQARVRARPRWRRRYVDRIVRGARRAARS